MNSTVGRDVGVPGGSVVHFVSRITDSVFSFLKPATDALAQHGVPQTVVLLDDPLYRHLLPRFHESVRLVLAPYRQRRRLRLRSLMMAYVSATKGEQRPARVHVHGFVCLLLAIYASRMLGAASPTFYSPHGSRSLGPKRALATAAMWLARPFARGPVPQAIANIGVDARGLGDPDGNSIELVESPLPEPFFDTPPRPDARPLIITAGLEPNPTGAAQFAQCAVLLSDEPGLRCCWIGRADLESNARLEAAKVAVVDIRDDAERARRMSMAWIYLAPAGDHGFPVFLAEAMALGVPCVAWDTPFHRDVVRDGKTGFVCKSSEEALERVALLLASSELRRTMGEAARAEAAVRFDTGRFRDSLLKAYGDSDLMPIDDAPGRGHEAQLEGAGEADPSVKPANASSFRTGVDVND